MIKQSSFCLFLLIHFSSAIYANEKIPTQTNAINYMAQFNIFKRISKKETINLSHAYSKNKNLPSSNRTSLSYRKKLGRKFNLGIVTMLASGSRHNADWINPDGQWHWRDTQNRHEFNYGAYLQYKQLLNEKADLIFKARLHYQVNSFNNQQDLILRTGVISFISSKVSWLTQVDFHIPTNYQRSFLREFWIYSGLGKQLNKNLFLAFQASYGVEIWNESKEFSDRTNLTFKNTNKAFRIGPTFNFYY